MPDLRRSLAALALLLPACADDEVPDDLGTWPEDQVKVAASPALAHLAAAIDGGDALSVADLFHPDRLTFKTAPDPSALYAAQATAYAALPALVDAEPLRVLTYNVGLLSRWYPFTHVGVPHYLERRERSPVQLLGDDWDILFLEEAWELVDVDRFAAEAKRRGYAIYAGTPKKHEQHGLIILVREALIGDAAQEFAEVQFDAQREIEYFPGPGVKRGYLGWSFTHAPTGRRIHLYGTHFTSFPELFQERDVQARVLGGAAKDHPDDDIVLIGGDFNAGAYYPEDRFGLDGDEVITGWWHNTMMYPLILHYGGVVDTHSLLEPAHDVERMHQLLLPFDGDAYLKQPLAGRCADIPTDTFTGTDCNSIYDEQYAATEFPARLDYIFLRDVGAHVRVTESSLVYTAPFDFGGAGEFELSDHYGMSAILQIER